MPSLVKTSNRRPRLALVDDDPGVRRSLQLMLSGRGLEVRAYGAGRDLLADPLAREADVLVADYKMPEANGLELLARLRAAGWAGPAILITGYPEPDLAARALQAGFMHVLAKPLVDGALANTIAGLLGSAK